MMNDLFLKKTIKSRIEKIVIAVILSILFLSIFIALSPMGFRTLLQIWPTNNDEAFYYNQVKSMMVYGRPLGYYGYAGSHALFGTFGAHGIAILIPYYIVCKIFGITGYAICLMNIILFSACIYLYEEKFSSNIWETILFSMFFFSPFVCYYGTTWMVEGENYFFSALAALLMADIACGKAKKSDKVALGVIMTLAIVCKITWIALLIPGLVLILKKTERWKKIVLSTVYPLVTIGISFLQNRLFCAPYFEEAYKIEKILHELKSGALFSTLYSIAHDFVKDGVRTFFTIYSDRGMEVGKWFIIISIVASTVYLIKMFEKERIYSFVPLFVLLEFLAGTILLYAPDEYAIRTIYPAAVFALVFIFSMCEWGTKKNSLFILVILIFLSSLITQRMGWFKEREYSLNITTEKYAKAEKLFSRVLPNANELNKWENTIALFLDHEPSITTELAVPSGMGIQFYLSPKREEADILPRYCLVNNEPFIISYLEEKNYEVMEKNEEAVLLCRRR